MQNTDTSGIPFQWSISSDVDRKRTSRFPAHSGHFATDCGGYPIRRGFPLTAKFVVFKQRIVCCTPSIPR